MIYQAETEEACDMTMAKDIAETLHEHYPGHLWAVNVRGGIAIIRNLRISPTYGMVLHYNNIKNDANVRKIGVIRSGGEFLERAGLKRGGYDGSSVLSVDGIKKYRPVSY